MTSTIVLTWYVLIAITGGHVDQVAHYSSQERCNQNINDMSQNLAPQMKEMGLPPILLVCMPDDREEPKKVEAPKPKPRPAP